MCVCTWLWVSMHLHMCVHVWGWACGASMCVCALEKERDGEELGGVNRKVHWMIDVSWDQKMVEKSNRFSFFSLVMLRLTSLDDSIVSSHQPLPKGSLSPCPFKLCFDCRNVWLQPNWHCSIDFTIICCKMETIDPGSNPACSWALGHLLSSQSNWKFVTSQQWQKVYSQNIVFIVI